MEDVEIEQRFHLMEKEIEATASLMREGKFDLMAAINSLRIELEVLKSYSSAIKSKLASAFLNSCK